MKTTLTTGGKSASSPQQAMAEPIRKLLAEVMLFFHDLSEPIRCIDRVVDLEEQITDALATPTHQSAEPAPSKMVPWPAVTAYSGGAASGGVAAWLKVRLGDGPEETEFVRKDLAAEPPVPSQALRNAAEQFIASCEDRNVSTLLEYYEEIFKEALAEPPVHEDTVLLDWLDAYAGITLPVAVRFKTHGMFIWTRQPDKGELRDAIRAARAAAADGAGEAPKPE